ncbi:MAG: FAD-dependent oxidoreductase [Chloroflexota bacterium]|nr:FAD-dependent oxidoreductase [Chloroflexota bacterium]
MSEKCQGEENLPVVVIGAGIAGLSAALHLAERGLSPCVLEADPHYCGGRVSGGDVIELNGWHFRDEHAVHGIWSPYRNLQAMLARHTIRPMFVPAQEESWIYKRGNLVKEAPVGSVIRYSWEPPPFHYLALFLRPRFLGMLDLRDWLSLPLVWYGLLLAISIDPLREGQPMEGMWLSDLVKHWSPALRAFFIGLARNGLSAHPEEIPLSGFIAFLRFYTLLRRDAWAFSYLPADGGTCLVEPLVGKLREAGGVVEMGVRVTSLERDVHGWRVYWRSSSIPPAHEGEDGESKNSGSLLTQQVILATDAPNTATILHASPNLGVDTADLYWPRGMGTAIVRIWFDGTPSPGPEAGIFSGDFILDNFFWLHRIQDQYAEWHRATGGSVVEVHIYGPPGLLEEPDTVLLARAIADVQSAFPELRGHLLHQVLRRNDPTHTLFGLGPPERHLGIKTPWQDIFCCGDWVRHPTPSFFLERACVTGVEAANCVLESRGLETWPLLDYAPPEPLAGFIERLMVGIRQVLLKWKKR